MILVNTDYIAGKELEMLGDGILESMKDNG